MLKKRLCAKGFCAAKLFDHDPYAAFEEIQKFSQSSNNSNTVVFCDIDMLTPSKPYPLVCISSQFRSLFTNVLILNQMGIPNVVTVLMGYLRPESFETDFGKHEFLRKPIKESTLLACLREVWCAFDGGNSTRPPQRVERSNSGQKLRVQLSKPVLRPGSPRLSPQPVYPLNILVVEGIYFVFIILFL